jgi:hypothetical protein
MIPTAIVLIHKRFMAASFLSAAMAGSSKPISGFLAFDIVCAPFSTALGAVGSFEAERLFEPLWKPRNGRIGKTNKRSALVPKLRTPKN